MRTLLNTRLALALFCVCLTIVACTSGGGGGGGGGGGQPPGNGPDAGPDDSGLVITGASYPVPLGASGALDLTGEDHSDTAEVRVELFTQVPTDAPSACTLSLAADDVRVSGQSESQTLTVAVFVDSGTSNTPCTSGEEVGAFTVVADGTDVVVGVSEISLAGAALSDVRSGLFGLCLAATGESDATLQITQIGLAFVPPSTAGPGTGSEDDTPVEPVDVEPIEGPSPAEFAAEEDTRVSGMVSSATGGTLTSTGATLMTLDIPAGALPEDTEVSMTLLSDRSEGRYGVVAMFEPDGLELGAPATLTIILDPPLAPEEALRIVEMPSTDARVLLDTGLLAEVSEDGTAVRIPVEHFSASGYYVNCHAYSLRQIIQALTRPTDQGGQGMSKEAIFGEMRGAVGNAWIKRKSGMSDDEYDEKVLHAYADLQQKFEKLAQDDVKVQANEHELLAFLNTFYTLSEARLEPERDDQGRVKTDSSGNAIVNPVDADCLEALTGLAGRADHMPPILNFGKRFTVDGSSDEALSSEEGPVIYDGIPHSAPIVARSDGSAMIKQGVAFTKAQADALQDAREASRQNEPDRWEEHNLTMPPRSVVPVEIGYLDRLRSLHSGAAVTEEFDRWDADASLVTESKALPWVAARIWVPRGVSAEVCTEAEQEEPPQEPPAEDCTVYEPSTRWHLHYDWNCDGEADSENLWHLRADGSISDHWLGTISGSSWEVKDDRVHLYSSIGDTHREADLSADCKKMENGRYYYDDGTLDEDSTCWWAEKG